MIKSLMLFFSVSLSFPAWGFWCAESLVVEYRDAITRAVETLNSKENLPPDEVDRLAARVAIALVRAETALMIDERHERLEEIQQSLQQAQECGNRVSCWVEMTKTLAFQLGTALRAVRSNLTGERRAHTALQESLAQLAAAQVDVTTANANLAAHRGHPLLSLRGSVDRFVNFVNMAQDRLVSAGKAFGFKELAKPVVLRDFMKDLSMVLVYQFFAQASLAIPKYTEDPYASTWETLLNDPTNTDNILETLHMVSRTTEWHIFGNTALMMALQANQAATTTRTADDEYPHQLTDLDSLLLGLPDFMQGNRGYWTESKFKISTFMSLLPAELAAMVTFSSAKVAIDHGLSALTDWQVMTGNFMVQATALPVLLTYLSLKWSLFEKFINLGLLPQYRKGLEEVAQTSLNTFRSQNGIEPEWSLKDFYQLYSQVHASNLPRSNVRHWTWKATYWRSKLLSALIRRGKVHSTTAKLGDEHLRALLSTPEADKVFAEILKANSAFTKEMAWRITNRAGDAVLAFYIFGDLAPWLVGVDKP